MVGVVLEGGTLTSSAAGCRRLPVRLSGRGVWNGVGRGCGVVGTLLGPEGADPRGVDGNVHRVGVVVSWRGRPGPRTTHLVARRCRCGRVGLAGAGAGWWPVGR